MLSESFKNKLIKVFGLFFFLLMLIASAWFLFVEGATTLNLLFNDKGFFSYDRGALFMPGIFLGLLILLLVIIKEGVFKQRLEGTVVRWLNRAAITSIVLIFVLPITFGFVFKAYADSKNYFHCDGASNRDAWPIYKAVYYTASDEICKSLTEEYENTRYKPKRKVKSSSDNIVLP